MENKKAIQLTEQDLRNMIKESAMKILSELDWKTWASASKKNNKWRMENPHHRANQWNRNMGFDKKARDEFDKKHGIEYNDPKKGNINFHSFDGNAEINGSRDHDFKDKNPMQLNHNLYYMSKKYGKDGGYGRARMWDYAHETTPEEFYGDNEMGQKFRNAEKDVDDFNSGKTHYEKGKGWTNESKAIEEGRRMLNDQNYTHFAVNKENGKIVNGWDYKGYDAEDLKREKAYFFTNDLIDYGFNPKDYKILTRKFLISRGIDPKDNNNWSN